MEPIKVWIDRVGKMHRKDGGIAGERIEHALVPRDDYDALAAEAADARTLRAERDSLVKERDEARRQRDGMTEQYESAMEIIHRNAGARRDGLCGILAWIDEAKDATARAEKAEALLREARGVVGPFLRLLNKAHEIVMPSIRGLFALSKRRQRVENALARIDAHLAAKGQTAPTPADPTNHAPKATSAAVCTELKEP